MPESFIDCPICRKSVALTDPVSPFCSERCRLLDLGNWASGRYTIPVPRSDSSPEEERYSDNSQSDEGE